MEMTEEGTQKVLHILKREREKNEAFVVSYGEVLVSRLVTLGMES
jgi:hypothetical protein